MENDLQEIESMLHALRPRALPSHLHQQLEDMLTKGGACHVPADSSWSVAKPAALPPDLANRLEDILSRVPHPGSGKLIHFPERGNPSRPSPWRKYAVAAAVAMMGASSALLVPHQSSTLPTAQIDSSTSRPEPAARNAQPPGRHEMIPANYRSGLSEAKDAGIIWQDQHGPQRMLQLVFRDKVTMKDQSGRLYQVERPRVEYVFIPAQVD